MELFKKDRRQAASTLFPGNYFVFRNLALQVPPTGVQASPISFSLTARILAQLVPWLQYKAQNEAGWEQFRSVDQDRMTLVERDVAELKEARTERMIAQAESAQMYRALADGDPDLTPKRD